MVLDFVKCMLVVDIKSERIENCSKNWEELGWELIIIVNKMGLILICLLTMKLSMHINWSIGEYMMQ